jgi:hypothetical protein
MSMTGTIQVLNRMVEDRIVQRYAIGGAVAALNYVEPRFTSDLDIFITFDNPSPSGLVTLGPIPGYLAKLGYTEWKDEGLLIEGWPVQFLPASDRLDSEALEKAVEIEDDFGSGEKVRTRVFSAEHVVAIAVRTGRPKDFLRVDDFIGQAAVNLRELRDVLERHDLLDKWAVFCRKTGRSDPLALIDKL